jgi:hypothetical protein
LWRNRSVSEEFCNAPAGSREPVNLLSALVALTGNSDQLSRQQITQCTDNGIEAAGVTLVDIVTNVRSGLVASVAKLE